MDGIRTAQHSTRPPYASTRPPYASTRPPLHIWDFNLRPGDLPNFLETFLFVDRFEQNLHSICKMKNKIYFAHDTFPVFFVASFLFI